jgi:flagellar biosynthesis/type III secretory pathway M-ring protein FliF/YscJ
MNLDLRSLLEQLAKAPGRTKLVLAMSVLALVAALAIGGYVSGQPHYVTLYSNLGDQERVAVEKALAGAAVKYRVSSFPGPYVVYVNEAQYDQAQIAVALEEALKQTPQGIESGAGGASTIFMSAGERAQSMQKREWQEAERLLEHLDFVADATVTTSMPDSSPLRVKKPVMVSVALELRGATTLSAEQARNVARLVMYRFGSPAENVMITDASGRTLYDPSALEDKRKDVRDLFEHSSGYDRALAAKALQHIEAAFGARKAVVTVTSQWNYDQSTTVDEKLDPETIAVQTETKSTQSPSGTSSGVGGAAGVPNAAGFGNENAGVAQANSTVGVAKTLDEKKTFEASRQRTQTVRSTPHLERLFVSLVLDESLGAKQAEIQRIVEAAVGFDKSRQDVFGVTTTAFAVESVEEGAEAPEGAAPTEEGAPNRMLEMLLERGVEIASALVFLFLLVSSLKGSKKLAANAGGSAGSTGGGSTGAGEASIDPEVLARAQIEELVRSDPRRVGEILSRWIDEKSTAKV